MIKHQTSPYKHIWSILCQSTSIDRDSNRLSILNIIEEVTVQKLNNVGIPVDQKRLIQAGSIKAPSIVPLEFEIMSLFERLDDKDSNILTKKAQLELTDPLNKSLLTQIIEINFPKGFKRLRYRIKINGLPITTAGAYRFIIRIQESEDLRFTQITEIPLDIKFA